MQIIGGKINPVKTISSYAPTFLSQTQMKRENVQIHGYCIFALSIMFVVATFFLSPIVAHCESLFIQINSDSPSEVLDGYDLKPILESVYKNKSLPRELILDRLFVSQLLSNRKKQDPSSVYREESIKSLTAALDEQKFPTTHAPTYGIVGMFVRKERPILVHTQDQHPNSSILRIGVKWVGSPEYSVTGAVGGNSFGGVSPSMICPEITAQA
jgi:hypothetical protein